MLSAAPLLVSQCLLTTHVKVFFYLFLRARLFRFSFSPHQCPAVDSCANDTWRTSIFLTWAHSCVYNDALLKSSFLLSSFWFEIKQWSRAKTYLKCISALLPSHFNLWFSCHTTQRHGHATITAGELNRRQTTAKIHVTYYLPATLDNRAWYQQH